MKIKNKKLTDNERKQMKDYLLRTLYLETIYLIQEEIAGTDDGEVKKDLQDILNVEDPNGLVQKYCEYDGYDNKDYLLSMYTILYS
jgi:hypothetical protein